MPTLASSRRPRVPKRYAPHPCARRNVINYGLSERVAFFSAQATPCKQAGCEARTKTRCKTAHFALACAVSVWIIHEGWPGQPLGRDTDPKVGEQRGLVPSQSLSVPHRHRHGPRRALLLRHHKPALESRPSSARRSHRAGTIRSPSTGPGRDLCAPAEPAVHTPGRAPGETERYAP